MAAPHPTDSIAACLATHEQLSDLLHEHQCTLVTGKAQAARSSLALFADQLEAHLCAEETVLIPLFERHCQPPPAGCSADLLLTEHRKLRRLLGESVQRLADTPSQADGRWLPSQILDLIEAERSLREVLDHHDQRERAAFFPVLAEALGPARWAEQCARFVRAHESRGASG